MVIKQDLDISFGESLRHSGSHLIMKHPDGRRTTVPIHFGRDIPKGTLLAILRDIGISKDKFLEIL